MALGGFVHQLMANYNRTDFKYCWTISTFFTILLYFILYATDRFAFLNPITSALITLGMAGGCLICILGRTIFYKSSYSFGPFHPQWYFSFLRYVIRCMPCFLLFLYYVITMFN